MDDLRKVILAEFQKNPLSLVYTAELRRKLGVERKLINSHLYALQREGIIKKVVESPPAWSYVNLSIDTIRNFVEEGAASEAREAVEVQIKEERLYLPDN